MKQICVVLLLIIFKPVFADTFRVALPDEDYPPFHFTNTHSRGILNQVISQFSAELGYELEYVFVPEMRSAKLVHDNDVDARMESELWQVDSDKYYWSDGIVTIEDVVIVGREVDPSIFHSQNEFISGVLLGHYGYTYPEYEALVKNKVIHRENFYSDLAMLQSLQSDTNNAKRFAVMSRAVFNWYCKMYPAFKTLNKSAFNVGKAPLQLQFSHTPRGKERAEAFNIFLKKLKDSGELDRIIARYQ